MLRPSLERHQWTDQRHPVHEYFGPRPLTEPSDLNPQRRTKPHGDPKGYPTWAPPKLQPNHGSPGSEGGTSRPGLPRLEARGQPKHSAHPVMTDPPACHQLRRQGERGHR